MSRTRARLALLVLGLMLGACGGDDEDGTRATAPGCRGAEQGRVTDAQLPKPEQTVRRGERLTAVVRTSCGKFEISLDTQRAPKTVNSFAYLAREGFYDGLGFHRVAPDFVIQGGDPSGDGTGGPGYSIDEKPPANLAYTEGVVAMAKSAAEPPGRSGSQFFVVTVPDTGLSPDYALLGRVSSGMQVVERIAALGTASQRPRQPVVIERLTIERG